MLVFQVFPSVRSFRHLNMYILVPFLCLVCVWGHQPPTASLTPNVRFSAR
jgi:hypothetical protein